MTEQTKSLIRHLLTAVGFVLGLIGLNQFTGVIDIIISNLDNIWGAIVAIVGVITTVIGYLRDGNRHVERAEGKASIAAKAAKRN